MIARLHRFTLALRNLAVLAIALYIFGMLLLVPLWAFAPRLHTLVEVTNIFGLYMFLPLLLLLPLALWWRAWWLRSSLLLLLGLLLVDLVPPLLAVQDVAAQDVVVRQSDATTPLRVATLNVAYNNNDPAGTLATLAAQDADLIALQELLPDMAAAFESLLPNYPHQALFPADRSPGGVGLISRYPIASVQQLEGVRGLRAELLIDGQPVTVLVAHPNRPGLLLEPLGSSFPLNQLRLPGYSSATRDQQVARLLDIVPTIEGPLLLAGDLNLADREPGYTALDALLHDAYAETNIGLGHTYPRMLTRASHTWLPPLRIDYIWTRSGLLPLAAHVNCAATGSDHCMLVADLVLLESQY